MLLSDFPDPFSLYLVPRERLSAFQKNRQASAMRTVCFKVDEATLSEEDRLKLDALHNAYGAQVDRFLRLLGMCDYRRYAIGDRYRDLRDQIVADQGQAIEAALKTHAYSKRSKKVRARMSELAGNAAVLPATIAPKIDPILTGGLQARHWKLGLQQASGTLFRWWRLLQSEALAAIRRKKSYAGYTMEECRYIVGLLSDATDRFFDMMDGRVPLPVKLDDVDKIRNARGLCIQMVRAVHDAMGHMPRRGENRSVWFDESCYTSTYIEAEDRTLIELMSPVPGKHISLKINGRVPIRDFCLRRGRKERVRCSRSAKPTIQTVRTEVGLEIHVTIPLKSKEVKLDQSLRSLASFEAVRASGRLSNTLMSNWFESDRYESTYDMAANETTVRFFENPKHKGLSLTFAGELPFKDRKITKKGRLQVLKSKHKPLVRLKRSAGRTTLDVLGNPVAPAWVQPPSESTFVRLHRCPVKTMTGTCGSEAGRMPSRWIGAGACTVTYDEAKDETIVAVNRPREGMAFTATLAGHAPLREMVRPRTGKTHALARPKKPSFHVVFPSKNTVALELILNVETKPVAEEEDFEKLARAGVESYEGVYPEKVQTSIWYLPQHYCATHDVVRGMTEIRITPPDGGRAFAIDIAGHDHLAQYRRLEDGTVEEKACRCKPAIQLAFVGRDQETGVRLLEVRMQGRIRPKDVADGDASLSDPDLVRAMAFDLGYTEVAYDALGNRFGEKLGGILSRFADFLLKADRARNRFRAMTMPPRAQPDKPAPAFDKAKARRIRRCNLGEATYNRRLHAFREEFKKEVNRALNEMFDLHAGAVFIIEAFALVFRYAGISKYWRRRLSAWVRGLLAERLEFKAAERRVRLIYVPAAYSSQSCPVCGHTDRKNRKGNVFRCRKCGTEAHADAKAAQVLLLRVHDKRFHRYSTMSDIKQHHREDHQAYLARQ